MVFGRLIFSAEFNLISYNNVFIQFIYKHGSNSVYKNYKKLNQIKLKFNWKLILIDGEEEVHIVGVSPCLPNLTTLCFSSSFETKSGKKQLSQGKLSALINNGD